MTTLKEYKAMMEGATDAPWNIIHDSYIVDKTNTIIVDCCQLFSKSDKINTQFIVASRNITPELIRVIELAEELTLEIQQKRHVDFDKVSNLREEIRKLKGE